MTRSSAPACTWRLGRARELSLAVPQLMGVVNATPDSFSDGGRWSGAEALLGRALRLVEEGASIIDVGGESTRPGASRVNAREQIDRVAGLVSELRRRSDVPISVDTTLAVVASAALDVGADIINDVAAGLEDEAMLPLAAERGCAIVLMHRRVPPGDDSYSDRYDREPSYQDVVADVRSFLDSRCAAAEAAGVDRRSIAIDPGLGFGKSVDQNYELLRRMADLVETGRPVLGAASRKSFIGRASGVAEPRLRLAGSLAASVLQLRAGVRLFRVHDVAAHREALAVAQAVEGGAGLPPQAGGSVGTEARRAYH